MKFRSSLLFFCAISASTLASAVPLNRIELAKQAEAELLGLHFFYKNRGMILPPSFLPVSLKKGLGKIGLGIIEKKLEKDFGLVIDSDRIIGYHEVKTELKNRVGVVGCAICHTGRAAGQTVVGLGNKNIDIFQLAMTAKKFHRNFEAIDKAKPWHSKEQKEERREIAAASKHFMEQIGDPELHSLTQGLIPVGLVKRWFYQIHELPLDSPEPGQVKIPSFWGYGEKRKVGSFSDGFGNGVQPGWAVAVELVAGQTVDNVEEYLPKIHHAEDVLAELLPPEYPFEIDQEKALRGKTLFENSCARCHGHYSFDESGHPIYTQPKHIPWHVIQTDATRLQTVTPLFRELIKQNPLFEILNATDLPPGYFAPRLHGIWARFPYLHNGSVPTVFDLLSPEEKRPLNFSLRKAGEKERFDPVKLGLNTDRKISQSRMSKLLKKQSRYIFDTQRHGHSNKGHNFSWIVNGLSDTERYEIIEYLKTL